MTPFSYLILRVVPSVERGECVNVGVVLFCRQQRFLGMLSEVDAARLAALAPGVALADVGAHLAALARVADGDPAAGPIAALDQSERFGWLAAPSSTIVQASAVHTGLCEAPADTLRALFARLVAPPAESPSAPARPGPGA
jgi:hypothetical protein